jgi:hypothetical protein
MKGEIKLMHSFDRIFVGFAAMCVITLSVLGIPKAYGQACFGSCMQMNSSKPIVNTNDARKTMQRLGTKSNSEAHAAAANSQRLRRSNQYPADANEDGLNSNKLSDSSRVNAESQERMHQQRMDREKQQDCTNLALRAPGTGGGSTYARNRLGC